MYVLFLKLFIRSFYKLNNKTERYLHIHTVCTYSHTKNKRENQEPSAADPKALAARAAVCQGGKIISGHKERIARHMCRNREVEVGLQQLSHIGIANVIEFAIREG